ncbi:MAG: lysylphosphatidylglycerol synthase domain-containing protein [Steroidobacteraceae bacterium]
MKLRIAIIAALGLALALYLVTHVGFAAVFSAAVAVGWGGFAILCLYVLGPFLILGAAWYVLLRDSPLKDLRLFVWARMVRDAATEVLPFSQVGGIVIGARAAILHGISQPLVFASVIADVTTEMLAQIAYIALGVAILSARVPRTAFTHSLITGLSVGLAIVVIAGAVFLVLQRYSRNMTARLLSRIFPGAVAATAGVTAALQAIYRSPLRVGVSVALHFAGWIASAIGVWIAFRLIGAHLDLAAVLAIESLICATRSVAALIPNALGVQEAAYAILAPLFGVGAEVGLAVSLLKRARDISVGVPILLIWQAAEGQRAFGRAQQ